MVLPDIKQLAALLKLLRAQGVTNYNSTDLQLVLSEKAPENARVKSLAEETMGGDDVDPVDEIERLIRWNDKLSETES